MCAHCVCLCMCVCVSVCVCVRAFVFAWVCELVYPSVCVLCATFTVREHTGSDLDPSSTVCTNVEIPLTSAVNMMHTLIR